MCRISKKYLHYKQKRRVARYAFHIVPWLLLTFPLALFAKDTVLHDPTLRPLRVIQDPKLLHKKYPIDTVITREEGKKLQIRGKLYQPGDYLDESLKIVDIKTNKIILENSRHGYVKLYLTKR